MAIVEATIAEFPRARVISKTDQYLHAEFRTRLMHFVDDVEFLLPSDGVVHVRSASRIGRGDMGTNRRRVEAIRLVFDRLKNIDE
jgi:uncharacterized protein (DUF1499 family)